MTVYTASSDIPPEIKIFESPTGVAQAFTDFLLDLIPSLPKINIALSGGSTPKALFDLLAQNYTQRVDWSKVHLYWGDERCVPPSHPDSNYGMTERHLISKVPIPRQNVHRVQGEDDPPGEAVRYSELLKSKLGTDHDWPVFDLVILGMGPDGHTASIFPHEMQLLDSEQVCDVATHPQTGQHRITLTGKVINQAKRVVFLVTGEEKAPKIKEILSRSGSWQDYPASHINPAGALSWYLDESAAGTRT